MLKRNYIKLNSKKVVNYKRLCYEMLNDILIDKKYYQKLVDNNQDNLVILDDKIKVFFDIYNRSLLFQTIYDIFKIIFNRSFVS